MSELIKLPGFVDVHVHLREPGATQKEDFSTGTQSAVAGGYTQVLDMPNNTPPTVTPNNLNQKIKLATGKIWCDLGFNFGATLESTKYFKQIAKRVFGLKVYMGKTTGPLLVEKKKDTEVIFKSWPDRLPIMVHTHDDTIDFPLHLAKRFKKRLHICHVTTNQMPAIVKAKKAGARISCEVTPHHLFLNTQDQEALGTLALMKPPLLSKNDQEKLWTYLDYIDMIATDHAPHTPEEKKDKENIKFGVPGLETTLPLMLTAVFDGALSMAKLTDMLSIKPSEVFHLPKQPDTYSIVDTNKTYKIKDKKLFTKCNWTPFAAKYGRGEIIEVVLRGKTVFKRGKFLTKPAGRVITPSN